MMFLFAVPVMEGIAIYFVQRSYKLVVNAGGRLERSLAAMEVAGEGDAEAG